LSVTAWIPDIYISSKSTSKDVLGIKKINSCIPGSKNILQGDKLLLRPVPVEKLLTFGEACQPAQNNLS
jgi:hypothetical protein